jgi:hypothetical protein
MSRYTGSIQGINNLYWSTDFSQPYPWQIPPVPTMLLHSNYGCAAI